MKSWRWLFLATGIFNVGGGSIALLTFEEPYVQAGMAPPLYPFVYQMMFVLVICLGVGFLIAFRDPSVRRAMAWVGLLAKASGLVIGLQAASSGQMPPSETWTPWLTDMPWAVGFAAFLLLSKHKTA